MNGKKIIALCEQEKEKFAGTIENMFGVVTDENTGIKRFDKSACEINARSLSLQEVAQDILGSDFRTPGYITRCFKEFEGSSVGPSVFSNVNAFVATTAGLVNALVLEAYEEAALIGDQLTTKIQGRTNGGKLIMAANDGAVVSTNYSQDGEPLETVGLKEAWVDVAANKRRGRMLKIQELTFIYDLTSMIQSSAENVGYAVAREREIDILNHVCGVTNTYKWNGTAYNTYQTAGALWSNALTNALNDYTDVAEAYALLSKNVDPNTGYEMNVDQARMKLLVSPARLHQTKALIRATQVRVTSNTNYNTYAPNPFGNADMTNNMEVLSSAIYRNVIGSDVYWHWVDPKAVMYKEIVPFAVTTIPLASDDYARGIAAVYMAQEVGVPVIAKPQLLFQSTGAS